MKARRPPLPTWVLAAVGGGTGVSVGPGVGVGGGAVSLGATVALGTGVSVSAATTTAGTVAAAGAVAVRGGVGEADRFSRSLRYAPPTEPKAMAPMPRTTTTRPKRRYSGQRERGRAAGAAGGAATVGCDATEGGVGRGRGGA